MSIRTPSPKPPVSPPVVAPAAAAAFPLDGEQGIADFLDSVCRYCRITPDASQVDGFCRNMSDNGFIFVKQLKSIELEFLTVLGLPNGLVAPVSAALAGKLNPAYVASLTKTPVKTPVSPSKDPLAPPSYNELPKPVKQPKPPAGEEAKWPIDPSGSDLPPYMSNLQPGESQISTDGLDFGTCKICKNPSGAGTVMLDCMHCFCDSCLRQFILDKVNQKKVSELICPSTKCRQEVPQFLIRQLLGADYTKYEEASISAVSDVFSCPNAECKVTISSDSNKQVEIPKVITEKDEKGKVLSREAFQHFSLYRLRCPSCNTNFCASCKRIPYHKGFTCEAYEDYLKSKQCRFCHSKLTPKTTPKDIARQAPTLQDVCNSEECIQKRDMCCEEQLPCGCPCNGVRDENTHLPCLKCDLNIAGDYCAICYVEALQDAPCIQNSPASGCKHVYHFQCVKSRIESGYTGARVTFTFMCCPQDSKPFDHVALDHVLTPIRALEAKIRKLAMDRLKYESRENDKELKDPENPYYQNPLAYAMHLYLFFMCYECKKPYFAGGYQCQAGNAGFDPKELVCPACQPEAKNMEECPTHGKDWIAFKCRFCCQFANWFCWSKTHFCDNCHQSGVWQTLATYQTGANVKKIWEYKQCDGLQSQIQATMAKHRGASDDDMNKHLEKLLANPNSCPLHLRHPPNGFEFGMGCTMCADKADESDQKVAAEKAEREKEEKREFHEFLNKQGKSASFQFQSDFDENGVMFYLGSLGCQRVFENPAKKWLINVTTSSISPGSEKPSEVCGRRDASVSTTAADGSSITIEFTELLLVPSYYSIKHSNEENAGALRSWTLEGSKDGSAWTKLRSHKRDSALAATPGSVASWDVNANRRDFRFLRIRQEGPNSAGANSLHIGGIEFYGSAKFDTSKK